MEVGEDVQVSREGAVLGQEPVEVIVENRIDGPVVLCGEPVDLFKKDGGKATAERMSVPFLGTIPFYQDMVRACDEGRPVMSNKGDSEFHKAFEKIIHKIVEKS